MRPDFLPVLADTSVWIHHFRTPDERILRSVRQRRLRMHPMVIGELACGNLHERPRTLNMLHGLRGLPAADDEEVLALIEEHGLNGRGVGWVDLHLVAASQSGNCGFRARDKRLREVALEVLGKEKVWA